jgi:hypothetical protein
MTSDQVSLIYPYWTFWVIMGGFNRNLVTRLGVKNALETTKLQPANVVPFFMALRAEASRLLKRTPRGGSEPLNQQHPQKQGPSVACALHYLNIF